MRSNIVKNLKQWYSSALQLSGWDWNIGQAELSPQITEHLGPYGASIAETIDTERPSRYVWKQKFSKPQNIKSSQQSQSVPTENPRKLLAEKSMGWKSMPACDEWVAWKIILIYITERCFWKNLLQHAKAQKEVSNTSVLAEASCWPAVLQDSRIFPWKLHTAPEDCNPAGDVHHQHRQCANDVLLINQQQ